MQRRQRRDELLGERVAERRRKRLAAFGDPRQRRFAFDSLADEERRSEGVGVVAPPIGLGHRHGGARERIERGELRKGAVGREQPFEWTHP